MKKVAFANIVDEANLGDMHCNPGRLTYIQLELAKLGWEAVACDFRNIPMGCNAVVFGGGGMLHPNVDLQLEAIAKVKPTACWGVGINYHEEHGEEMRQWKRALNAMTGPVCIRDPGYSRLTTPCPSCLDPRLDVALNESVKVPRTFKARPLIIYHKQHPINYPFSLPPRMVTNDCSTGFAEMLALIGNSRFVVTNTFHGAMWSIMLGVQPWIPKEQMFSTRHATAVAMGAKIFESWHDIKDFEPFPAQLPRYQEEAMKFFGEIKSWLSML